MHYYYFYVYFLCFLFEISSVWKLVHRTAVGFTCPLCNENFITTRSFKTHLNQTYGLKVSIDKKYAVNDTSEQSVDLENTGPKKQEPKVTRKFIDVTNDQSIDLEDSEQKKQEPEDTHKLDENNKRSQEEWETEVFQELEAQELQENTKHIPQKLLSNESKQPKMKKRRLSKRDVVLLAGDAVTSEKAVQDDKVMAQRLGRFVPIVHTAGEQQLGLLTSASIASFLLAKRETCGTWFSPENEGEDPAVQTTTSNSDFWIGYLKENRYYFLLSHFTVKIYV